MNDPAARDELIRHNQLIRAVGDKLFQWYSSGWRLEDRYTPHMSFSTGFRTTNYNRDGKDPEGVVFALKLFPMNVSVTAESMRWALHCVQAARDEVLAVS